TTETDAGLQEGPADTWIEANSLRDLADVGSSSFTQIGDSIDERNFHRQKRIGSMLDQLGTIRIGDQEWNIRPPRTALMSRACKPGIQYRLITFAHQVFSARTLHADHNPVGMKEIFDCRTFPQKLWVGGNVILKVGAFVQRKMAAQL